MKLGAMVKFNTEIREGFEKIIDMGFSTCQLTGWEKELFTDEYSQLINEYKDKYGIEITAFWCGWHKPAVWNFYDGPATLGLVPAAYRSSRTETLVNGSDFAKKIGVNNFVTHVGFIPENPNDSDYIGVVNAVRYIANYCRGNGQRFLFETGQETPVTLKRIIEDIGLDNVGVNLDPANLLLYGKGNPIDALDIIGEYVMGVHAKDGEYPTDGRNLGREKPIGQGRVNFPKLIEKLKELGYNGALTIEREIKGEKQIRDILAAKEFLEKLI